MNYERGNPHEFTSLVRELAPPGDLTTNKTFDFEFVKVEKPYESYTGGNVALRWVIPPWCIGIIYLGVFICYNHELFIQIYLILIYVALRRRVAWLVCMRVLDEVLPVVKVIHYLASLSFDKLHTTLLSYQYKL